MGDYRVWECKIVIDGDARLPEGFDLPPRLAAMSAVDSAGIKIISCFSGWGGSLTPAEYQVVQSNQPVRRAASE